MFLKVTMSLLEGFMTTLQIFGLTLLMALPLGLILSFGSMSKFKVLKYPVKTLIWIIRGTPLMLQLITINYGPGLIATNVSRMVSNGAITGAFLDVVNFLGMTEWKVPSSFMAVIISFVINYACYFSEIFRGGIESIPKGQYEAGQVLGLTRAQTFFKVVLFQVIKRVVPPLANETITLVKDTSLARIVTIYEVIWAGQKFIKGAGLLWPLFYTGVFYLIFNGILTLLFGYIEKKMDYYKG